MSAQFPDNSKYTRPTSSRTTTSPDTLSVDRKPLDKVIAGDVTTRKQSLGKRIRNILFGDNGKSVGEYILEDVLIPAARDTVDELITGTKDLLLFGERRSRTRAGGLSVGRSRITDYGAISRGGRGADPVVRVRQLNDFDDIELETRGDAELVIACMCDILDTYNQVTVRDLRDLVGQTGSYTDSNWGWKSLSGAQPLRVRGSNKYVLDLPNPISLK